jgi:hypothetical protein
MIFMHSPLKPLSQFPDGSGININARAFPDFSQEVRKANLNLTRAVFVFSSLATKVVDPDSGGHCRRCSLLDGSRLARFAGGAAPIASEIGKWRDLVRVAGIQVEP